jgi:hypothetical protein
MSALQGVKEADKVNVLFYTKKLSDNCTTQQKRAIFVLK